MSHISTGITPYRHAISAVPARAVKEKYFRLSDQTSPPPLHNGSQRGGALSTVNPATEGTSAQHTRDMTGMPRDHVPRAGSRGATISSDTIANNMTRENGPRECGGSAESGGAKIDENIE